MTEQPQDEQVPGGGLAGNEPGASSDGDSGPQGAGTSGSAQPDDEAAEGSPT